MSTTTDEQKMRLLQVQRQCYDQKLRALEVQRQRYISWTNSFSRGRLIKLQRKLGAKVQVIWAPVKQAATIFGPMPISGKMAIPKKVELTVGPLPDYSEELHLDLDFENNDVLRSYFRPPTCIPVSNGWYIVVPQ
jgi:hypothetical protein